MVDVPISFSGTPFYYIFRAVWFCVGLVVFLWTATVMYEYWNVMSQYKLFTEGDLKKFMINYDKKFVPSVIVITIFLAWPLCNMALEVGFFVVLLIPYYFYRNMAKQGIEFIRYPIETPLDAIPGWVRLDTFFTEFRQAKRLGFSLPLWYIVTGTYDEYLDCMGPPNMMPPPGYPGAPQSGQQSAFGGNGRGAFPANSAVEMSQATIVPDDLESPTRKSKKSKAERSDSQSHERRSKSRDKKEKRRESIAVRGDESAADLSESTTGAFNNTNALDNFDGTKRDKKKKEKVEKVEKKPKKEKSKSKKDKRDLDDEN
jgi:hypothetical protein